MILFFRADKYTTFGLNDEANLTRAEGASHQLMACAWFFSTLDEAAEAELSSIVRKAAGRGRAPAFILVPPVLVNRIDALRLIRCGLPAIAFFIHEIFLTSQDCRLEPCAILPV